MAKVGKFCLAKRVKVEWLFHLNLSANSVMRGRLDARRTLKSLVADLRLI